MVMVLIGKGLGIRCLVEDIYVLQSSWNILFLSIFLGTSLTHGQSLNLSRIGEGIYGPIKRLIKVVYGVTSFTTCLGAFSGYLFLQITIWQWQIRS